MRGDERIRTAVTAPSDDLAYVKRGRELLRIADCAYIAFNELLEASFGHMSAGDLEAIEAAAAWFSQTNCGWSEYHLTKTQAFRDAIKRARYNLARAEADRGGERAC